MEHFVYDKDSWRQTQRSGGSRAGIREDVQQEVVNILMSRRTVLEPRLFGACTVFLLYIWCQTMYEAEEMCSPKI